LQTEIKNIFIAPLNWGLGHATRCIPIINALKNCGFNPIIASDGAALELLKKEFPDLTALSLPSYKIEYPKNGRFFKLKMLQNLPNILFTIYKEKEIVAKYIDDFNISGIISDNRFGVYNSKIPSVYITHQLRVLSGNTTWFSSKIHQNIIRKFTECWVPDFAGNLNYSGKLGHLKKTNLKIKYLGILSRLENETLPKKYDLMIVLSGIEPQRSILENILKTEIVNYKGNIIFIKGIVDKEQKLEQNNNVLFYNYMTTTQLQQAFNESETVLCRSGYTTIMDLIKLNKKAFLIPTPGQFEQEYLATKLSKEGVFPTSNQADFKIEMLNSIYKYNNETILENDVDWNKLFNVFSVKKT
jgi:uncharacterized protein (TIGR00661 family)